MPHASELLQLALTAFTTLVVVIDPVGLIPFVAAYTRDYTRQRRAAIYRRAIVAGLSICLLFLAFGHAILAYLGISLAAFSISGGILLFVTAFPMLFGRRGSLQSSGNVGEHDQSDGDIAVFPIAIPLIAGPCTLTSVLLFAAQAKGDPGRMAVVTVALLAAFLVTSLCLWLGARVTHLIGDDGINVVTRLLGLVLAALAVQFVLNGATSFINGSSLIGMSDVPPVANSRSAPMARSHPLTQILDSNPPQKPVH
ncbi:MAG TPA: MarC family protein [Capsulimonadaceae bacterium]